jgi:hypothetical protein
MKAKVFNQNKIELMLRKRTFRSGSVEGQASGSNEGYLFLKKDIVPYPYVKSITNISKTMY